MDWICFEFLLSPIDIALWVYKYMFTDIRTLCKQIPANNT